MADKAQADVLDEGSEAQEAPASPPPRRSPGHRGADMRDTMAEMAAKAHEISLEAGSKMAGAMRDVIGAAAGLTGFAVESARDLVQYMVRRGQMTQDEADRLIREAEEAASKRVPPAPAAEPSRPTIVRNEAPAPKAAEPRVEPRAEVAPVAPPRAAEVKVAEPRAAEPVARSAPKAAPAKSAVPAKAVKAEVAKPAAKAAPAAKGAASKAPAKSAKAAPKPAAKAPAKAAAKAAPKSATKAASKVAPKAAAKAPAKAAAKKASAKKR